MRRQVFYGWYIVAASVTVMTLCISGAGYLFGVFFPVLIKHFGWSRAELSGANSVCLLTISALGPLVGRLTDRYGPKVVMAAGAVLSGLGYAGLGLVGLRWLNEILSPLSQFYFLSVIFGVGVATAAFVPVNTVVANWFVRKRGLAMGITATGMSLGGLVMIPLTGLLIDSFGWRVAYGVLGALMLIVVLPVAVLVMRRRPEELGLCADGETANGAPEGQGPPRVTTPAGERIGLAAALRSWSFWALGLAYAFYGLAQASIMVHAIALLVERGISAQHARLTLSLLALCSTGSKIAVGYLADWMSPAGLVVSCFALLGLGTAVLAAPQIAFAWAFALCCGVAMGGIVALEGPLVAEYFGLLHFGAVFGAVSVFMLGASAASSVISGYMYDRTGSYAYVFTMFAIAQAVAALLIMGLGLGRSRRERTATVRSRT